MSIVSTLVTGLAAPITNLVSEFIEDPDKKNEIDGKIKTLLEQNAATIEQKAADVILAEAQSDNWMAKSWRPALMCLFMFLIFFNAVVVPILWTFGFPLPTLEAMDAIPEQMWTLLIIGMGGYLGGRSVEKTVKLWREGAKNSGNNQ